MTNKNVEETKIYKNYLDLINYIEIILEKYPKNVKMSLCINIRNDLYEGMRHVLEAYKRFNKEDKLLFLHKIDVNLKMLKIYARISYKKKYINLKNYESWSRKINQVGINLGTWINICAKQ